MTSELIDPPSHSPSPSSPHSAEDPEAGSPLCSRDSTPHDPDTAGPGRR